MNPITLKTDVLNNLRGRLARPTAPHRSGGIRNPIIRRIRFRGLLVFLIVQFCHMKELIVYSVANRPTAFRSSIWDAARTASTGNLSRKDCICR